MHKNCTWNLPQYLQITITPRAAFKLIRPLNVYTETENWQIKKQLDVKRTQYICILFAFMILNDIWPTEDFISGLLYNTNHKNTKLGIKGTQFPRSPTDN
jgi:hypothetical protein